ncbi:uncharacterized protein LOC131934680 [Physella acuta]|uniref:uncharacterized protein LOC131934680 n=1 Tax=Physella acuta TaxID=109671 RepID=UPI0027DC4266|nr:uncharacterized protein LOC131934680 [Physella acuta]
MTAHSSVSTSAMFLLTVVLTLLASSLGGPMLPFNDPCRLTTVGDNVVLNISTTCAAGEIDWHYPTGSLLIQLTLPNPFSLCLELGWSTYIQAVKEVTSSGEVTLPLPTDSDPTCIKSEHNTAKMKIVAEDLLAYMTAFNYRVQVYSSTIVQL